MKQALKHKIGLLCACAATLSYMSITPVLSDVSTAFPNTDTIWIQMLVTIPSLFLMPFSLLAGQLAGKLGNRRLALLGVALELLGGLIPLLLHGHIALLLLGSSLNGAGLGFMMCSVNALICDHYDGAEQSQMLGLNAAFVNIGALLFSFVGGQLSKLGWIWAWCGFLLLIPILLLAWRWLPEDRSAATAADAQRDTRSSRLSYALVGCFVIGFFYFAFQNTFNTNAALLIDELQLGGAVIASYCTMCNSIGGIAGGSLFGLFEKHTGNQVQTLALGCSACGFLLAFFLPYMPSMLLSSLLIGLSFAVINASGTMLVARFCRPEKRSVAISAYLAVVNLGAAISPVLVTRGAQLLAQGVAVRFVLAGGVILLLTIACFCILRRSAGKNISEKV